MQKAKTAASTVAVTTQLIVSGKVESVKKAVLRLEKILCPPSSAMESSSLPSPSDDKDGSMNEKSCMAAGVGGGGPSSDGVGDNAGSVSMLTLSSRQRNNKETMGTEQTHATAKRSGNRRRQQSRAVIGQRLFVQQSKNMIC